MYRRASVPLDGSPVAEAILPFILEIAGLLDMEVILLRVIQPVAPQVIEGSPHVVVEDVQARMAAAREDLAPLAGDLRSKGVRTRAEVRRGDPAAEIVEGAHDTGADLIAMTTHGRGGLARLVFGSVAEAVLRQSRLPVFLMRLTESEVAHRAPMASLR